MLPVTHPTLKKNIASEYVLVTIPTQAQTSFGDLNFHLAHKCLRSTETPLSQTPC
jgi:hypothetical protein